MPLPAFLIQLVVILIVVGLLLYIAKLLPIDPVIKQIITAVAVVFVVIWLIYLVFGVGFAHPILR